MSAFDINAEIGNLLREHQRLNPTTQTPQAPRAPVVIPTIRQMHVVPIQSVKQFRGVPVQPTQQRPVATQQLAQTVNPNIPVANQHGIIINPRRFPGPLAHSVPAGVGGPVSQSGFTAEVEAARRNLAEAHRAILSQQSALRPRQ